ncbi:hypothetical protein Pla52o_50870 [Novipirellula galeiformis]|uniref:Uncharacterized protein n=1 Tax=Novipirellula galeiformis TaxID=2528004 RepID=A0A5C6C1M8_9BACT|nr:hypothetical protein Pla52o_50870 [Novipirellula galeiformis]
MFARYTHLVTLIAFAAHAVLGCCWHHSHALGNECCVQHSEPASPPEMASHVVPVTAKASLPHACCDHDNDHLQSPAAVAFATADHGLVVIQNAAMNHGAIESGAMESGAMESETLDHADLPCQDSHDCNEANCNFAAMQVKSLDLNFEIAFGEVPSTDVAAFAQPPAHSTDCERHRASRSQFLTSTQHCVRLQSWQI